MDPRIDTWVIDMMTRYQQPQFADSIIAWVRERPGGWPGPSVADLEQMVAEGRLKHVDGGVDGQGNRRVMYAPPHFEG
jgi:hypothetical protein